LTETDYTGEEFIKTPLSVVLVGPGNYTLLCTF